MDLARRIDALIAPHLRPGGPGCAIHVMQRGQNIFSGVYGCASVEHGAANTSATRFAIASMTKQLASAAVLIAQEKGLLSLDDPLDAHLPSVATPLGVPTLRQLLNHTAGLRCYNDITFCDGFAVKPPGSGLDLLSRQSGANFAPGESQIYSNSGHFLCSVILEKVADKAFEHVLKDWLFDPLGMTQTQAVRDDQRLIYKAARNYLPMPGGGWRLGVNVSDERLGDGCVYATGADMMRWLEAMCRQSDILSKPSWTALKTPPQLKNDCQSQYALGLQIMPLGDLTTYGHGGNVMGASCHGFTVPGAELSVLLLANTILPAQAVCFDIARLVLGFDKQDPAPAHIDLDGLFWSDQTGRLVEFINDEDDQSCVRLGGMPKVPLKMIDKRPALATPTGPVYFDADDDNLIVTEGGQRDICKRVKACKADGLSGCYESADARAVINIEHESDTFRVSCVGHYGHNEFKAEPIRANLFHLTHAMMPFSAIAHLKDDTVCISTGRTRALAFHKSAGPPKVFWP